MKGPLTIIHFNDVYNIEPQKTEPFGGAARMSHYIKSIADKNPLILFSGDALNPSLMSIFLRGDQMIPVLNKIGVHCAVYGNHDFDFGVDHLEDFAEQTTFPWLMSNITDKINNEPLAQGKIKHMIDWHGNKIGLMGLVEEEWIDTLSTVDPADITFQDFVEVGNQLATELRNEGADLVIALTHMRWPNDRKVAEMIPGVDIVLGGHDHDYNVEMVNGKYVLKSGTDFRNLSKITITSTESGLTYDIERVDLDSTVPEDPAVKADVDHLLADIDSKMDEHLGDMGVPLDGRFSAVRTQETNLGNFVCDIMLEAVPADICLLNSGTLRSDKIHPKGEFKLRDLLTILPLVDPLIVIQVTGKQLLAALENGVSQYPKLEGRFPQVAGVRFAFDPSKPPGDRVEPSLVTVQDSSLDPDKTYRVCLKEYIASGRDGYDVFKDCPVVVDSEQCPTISTAIRNHFESVQILNKEQPCRSGHRQSLCSIVRNSKPGLVWKRIKRILKAGIILWGVKDGLFVHGFYVFEEKDCLDYRFGKRTMLMRETIMRFQAASSLTKIDQHKTDRTKTDQSNTDQTNQNQSSVPFDDFRRESGVSDAVHMAAVAKATSKLMRQMSIQDVEQEQKHLCPKVDGRISHVDRQKLYSTPVTNTTSVQKDLIREESGES